MAKRDYTSEIIECDACQTPTHMLSQLMDPYNRHLTNTRCVERNQPMVMSFEQNMALCYSGGYYETNVVRPRSVPLRWSYPPHGFFEPPPVILDKADFSSKLPGNYFRFMGVDYADPLAQPECSKHSKCKKLMRELRKIGFTDNDLPERCCPAKQWLVPTVRVLEQRAAMDETGAGVPRYDDFETDMSAVGVRRLGSSAENNPFARYEYERALARRVDELRGGGLRTGDGGRGEHQQYFGSEDMVYRPEANVVQSWSESGVAFSVLRGGRGKKDVVFRRARETEVGGFFGEGPRALRSSSSDNTENYSALDVDPPRQLSGRSGDDEILEGDSDSVDRMIANLARNFAPDADSHFAEERLRKQQHLEDTTAKGFLGDSKRTLSKNGLFHSTLSTARSSTQPTSNEDSTHPLTDTDGTSSGRGSPPSRRTSSASLSWLFSANSKLPSSGSNHNLVFAPTCSNTCSYNFDGECDDGSERAKHSHCALGTDCADCGACLNTCPDANDGFCDDGGEAAHYSLCNYGTDCGDCGVRPFRESTTSTTTTTISKPLCRATRTDWRCGSSFADAGCPSVARYCDAATGWCGLAPVTTGSRVYDYKTNCVSVTSVTTAVPIAAYLVPDCTAGEKRLISTPALDGTSNATAADQTKCGVSQACAIPEPLLYYHGQPALAEFYVGLNSASLNRYAAGHSSSGGALSPAAEVALHEDFAETTSWRVFDALSANTSYERPVSADFNRGMLWEGVFVTFAREKVIWRAEMVVGLPPTGGLSVPDLCAYVDTVLLGCAVLASPQPSGLPASTVLVVFEKRTAFLPDPAIDLSAYSSAQLAAMEEEAGPGSLLKPEFGIVNPFEFAHKYDPKLLRWRKSNSGLVLTSLAQIQKKLVYPHTAKIAGRYGLVGKHVELLPSGAQYTHWGAGVNIHDFNIVYQHAEAARGKGTWQIVLQETFFGPGAQRNAGTRPLGPFCSEKTGFCEVTRGVQALTRAPGGNAAFQDGAVCASDRNSFAASAPVTTTSTSTTTVTTTKNTAPGAAVWKTTALCDNSCYSAKDGVCDDTPVNFASSASFCRLGTDCLDCGGTRTISTAVEVTQYDHDYYLNTAKEVCPYQHLITTLDECLLAAKRLNLNVTNHVARAVGALPDPDAVSTWTETLVAVKGCFHVPNGAEAGAPASVAAELANAKIQFNAIDKIRPVVEKTVNGSIQNLTTLGPAAFSFSAICKRRPGLYYSLTDTEGLCPWSQRIWDRTLCQAAAASVWRMRGQPSSASFGTLAEQPATNTGWDDRPSGCVIEASTGHVSLNHHWNFAHIGLSSSFLSICLGQKYGDDLLSSIVPVLGERGLLEGPSGGQALSRAMEDPASFGGVFPDFPNMMLEAFVLDKVFASCQAANGRMYRGDTAVTQSGHECLSWDTPNLWWYGADYQNWTQSAWLTGIGEHNYCRSPPVYERDEETGLARPGTDPFYRDGGVWCFVDYVTTGRHWEYCAQIPSCLGPRTLAKDQLYPHSLESTVDGTELVPGEDGYSGRQQDDSNIMTK